MEDLTTLHDKLLTEITNMRLNRVSEQQEKFDTLRALATKLTAYLKNKQLTKKSATAFSRANDNEVKKVASDEYQVNSNTIEKIEKERAKGNGTESSKNYVAKLLEQNYYLSEYMPPIATEEAVECLVAQAAAKVQEEGKVLSMGTIMPKLKENLKNLDLFVDAVLVRMYIEKQLSSL